MGFLSAINADLVIGKFRSRFGDLAWGIAYSLQVCPLSVTPVTVTLCLQ